MPSPHELAWSDAQEQELLTALRAGEEAAYEELVRLHGARMLAVARRYAASEEDAREVVQEAFASAFEALDRFHGDARLSTWLHRIVVNKALGKLREKERRRETDIEEALPAFTEHGHFEATPAPWHEAADAGLDREETRELVRSAIASLPEGFRNVLALRDIEGWDVETIAAHLGITPNAVRLRVHRARQALRTLLDPHFRRTGS